MYEIMGVNIPKQLGFYVIGSIIFVSVIVICEKIIRNKFFKIVKNSSLRYIDILNLNATYDFHELKDTYVFVKRHKSKAQFDRFNYTKFLEEKIEERIDFFDLLIDDAEENALWAEEYEMKLEEVSPYADKNAIKGKGVPYFIYKKIEKSIVSNIILRPIDAPQILCKSKYTSPKGKNSYYEETVFFYEEMVERFNIVCEKIEKRATKEYQRKLMTESLRYDIMKRDGFRCVLCGRSAEDGVKLHVDHIIPISKGGRTFPKNLRTLCDSCNLGKSDKYDEYGEN